ncbi:MAG TPA: peptidoglycan DD-metalloendopeptidase family protein [Rhizomicrobium sp.]|nr:peptidoglycan DD-metalloendopeptidase family protein [Rhizomicrobium sp.]
MSPDHPETDPAFAPFSTRLRRGLNGANAALATTDGRWALVSTSLTALVAGAVAWMAVGMMPADRPMVAPGRSSLPYALFMKLVRAGQPQEAADNADNANPNPGVESRTVSLDAGDTLAGMLEDVGISREDANAVVTAMGKNFDPRALKAGQVFDITYSVASTDAGGQAAKPAQPRTTTVMVNNKPVVVPVDADEDDASGATEENSQSISRLLSLHFSPSIQQEMTVTRTTEGGFTAELEKKELEVHRHRAGGTIDSSLYLAAMQAGIPADVVVDLIHMFSYKVDFQRDLHPGDKFEVYYDYYYTPDGQPAKYGAISYAMMTLGGKQIPMYRFQASPDEPAEYFDAKGESAKGTLMKTPVDGARISSGFGSRFHPILGYTRMHKGVDFAVPTGTPVMAAGAGTIKFMGRASGYGNFVKILHGNGYSTDYGHLSRFAPGMRVGARVRQGQVFAYSGMTGMATGPHLHYEILVNNIQVNPLTVKMAQGRMLAGKLLKTFQDKRQEIESMIASVALETKVADNATDLRQAKAK